MKKGNGRDTDIVTRFDKETLFYMIDLLLWPAAMIFLELLLRYWREGNAQIPVLILLGGGMGCLASAFTSLFPPKIRRYINMAGLFLLGLIFATEYLVVSSFQIYISLIDIVRGAKNVLNTFSSDVFRVISSNLTEALSFFLPEILYILACMRRHFLKVKGDKPSRRRVLFLAGAMAIVSAVSTLAGVRASSTEADAGAYDVNYSFYIASNTFGLLTGIRLDFQYRMFGNPNVGEFDMDARWPVAEGGSSEKNEQVLEKAGDATENRTIQSLNQYVLAQAATNKNQYTGLFQGKNLILICAEAFSSEAVHEELTPTLYRLIHNGFYFSDYYQPTWGGSTSTGEFSFLIGLAPLERSNSMLQVQRNNLYYTMGNQLARLGYGSACYHNGEYTFYARNLTHTNLGYAKFQAQGNGLETAEGARLTDQQMFSETIGEWVYQQPFSLYYMTIDGHCTYEAGDQKTVKNMERVSDAVGDRYQDTTLYYLCYQLELEYALEALVGQLEVAGIAEDTVICLTADHYPYGLKDGAFGNTQDYLEDLYGYPCTYEWERDHNSLILWSGCLETELRDMACEIDTPTYSLDILPTLLNLFGLDFDSRLLVGRDVFSEAEPLVFWYDGSWITANGKYDASSGEFFPAPGYDADDAYMENVRAVVSNKRSYSGAVVEVDYYNYLFGDDASADGQ